MKTIRGHPGTVWRKTCIRRAVLTVDADAPIRGPRVARQAVVRMDGRTDGGQYFVGVSGGYFLDGQCASLRSISVTVC